MRLAPTVENDRDPRLVRLELPMPENGVLHLRRLNASLAVARPSIADKQRLTQRGEDIPIGSELVEIAVGNAAVQMRVEIVQVFRLAGINVARDVQIIVVSRTSDLSHRHHAGITRQLSLPVEHIDDLVDVLCAQAILIAVLEEALARVDHEDTAAGAGVLFIEDQDTGGNAGSVKQISR